MTWLDPPSVGQIVPAVQDLLAFFGRIIQPLYAVLDSARDRRIRPLIQDSGCEYRMLYGERLAAAMDGVGPYLVALPRGNPFLPRLIQMGWGNSWGIFLSTPADLTTVRRHLRRLLAVKLPDGRQALFRFYDPRVLRNSIPGFREEEAAQFFGPISSIFAEPATATGQHPFREVLHFAKEMPLVPQFIQISKNYPS